MAPKTGPKSGQNMAAIKDLDRKRETSCNFFGRHGRENDIASLQQTELLASVIHEQDCRAIRTACCCLNSLRIRVEARANVTERAVISRQLQLMQASGQPTLPRTSTQLTQVARPEPRLNTSRMELVPVKRIERSHACTNAVALVNSQLDRIEYN